MTIKQLFSLLITPLVNFKKRSIFICGFVFSLILLSLYVFQVQTVISKEYAFKNHQLVSQSLSKDKTYLELEALGSTSLANLEEKIGSLDFTQVEGIKYINLSDDYLVKLAD